MTDGDVRSGAEEDWNNDESLHSQYKDFDHYYGMNQDSYYGRYAADGYTIYSDDFSQVLMESTAKEARKSAFVVLGNEFFEDDPNMFRRVSKKEMNDLNSKGYDVNVFDAGTGNQSNPAEVVKNGLENIRNLDQFSMYFHGGMDINLDQNKGFWSSKSEFYRKQDPIHRLSIDSLSVGHPTDTLRVNLYGCAGNKNSTYGQEMANALGVNVRGAPSGAGVIFPLGIPMPKYPNDPVPTEWRTYFAPGNEPPKVSRPTITPFYMQSIYQ